MRFHPSYRYDGIEAPPWPEYDIVLIKLVDDPKTTDPTIVWPMPVASTSPAAGTQTTVVGYGPGNGVYVARSGKWDVDYVTPSFSRMAMTVSAGQTPSPFLEHGDSGAPAFVTQGNQEVLVGVWSYGGNTDYFGDVASLSSWIDTNCDNCITNWQTPPAGYDPEDTATPPECNKDTDSDGVLERHDNCPDDANADQMNCNEDDDWFFHGVGNKKGDVCDPTPCTYFGLAEQVSHGYPIIKTPGPAELFSRGVGHTATSDYLNKDLHARYCSCTDPASVDPYDPAVFSTQVCEANICKTDGDINFDADTDQGWQYVAWTAPTDDYYLAPSSSTTPCTLHDDEGDGYLTQCNDPLPLRLFRKPHATGLGANIGDAEKYWTQPNTFRIRHFTWEWQKQDYPHPERSTTGQTWTPPTTPQLPTFLAHAWIWFHPDGTANPTFDNSMNNTYLLNNTLMGASITLLLPEAFRMPLRYQVPEMVLLPHPPHLVGTPPVQQLLLHTLAAGRPTEGIEDYLWDDVPSDSATIGLVVKRFNAANGDLGDATPSVRASGVALNTTKFAAAQLNEDNFYVFGGKTLSGELPSRLWHGWKAQDDEGRVVYHWEVLAEGGPAGRRGSVLVADPDRNRLLLLMGHTDQGRVIDVWSYSLDDQSWTQEVIQVPDLLPAASMAYAAANNKLYLYGGRDGNTFHEGLFEIDLDTLSGQRIDLISDPGPLAAAALTYNPQTRTLFLYGGRDSQGVRGDLWTFDLDSFTWELVSSPAEPGAPPAMVRASIALCPYSGAISVLSGQQDTQSAPEPMWRRRMGTWQSHSMITGYPQ